MDDFSRLEAKLTKLRQREKARGEQRVIRGTPDRLLSSVVLEIDETILPRVIVFTAEDGESFALSVANRRLQALAAGPTSGAGSVPGVGAAIADEDSELLPQIKQLLEDLFASRETWRVTSQKQSGGGFASDVGVPPGPLGRVWELVGIDGTQSPEEQLIGFLKGLGDRSSGWLRVSGEEVVDQFGEPSVVEALGNQAALFLDGYFSKKDVLFQGETGPTGLAFASFAEDKAVVFLDCGETMAFVVAKANDAAGLIADWQSLVAN